MTLTGDAPGTRTGPDADGSAPVVPRVVGAVLLVGGLVGAVTAVVLLLEKLALLTDPGYVPSCSIDPVLSCGTIMRTAQAEVLGFPNPVLGVAAFPAVAVLGALVLAGTPLPRWAWLGLQFGSTLGLGFVLWLMLESLLVIRALCPYCMVVWAATIAIFWYTTVATMATGLLGGGPAARTLVRRHGTVLAGLWALVVVAVVAAFPTYWASLVT